MRMDSAEARTSGKEDSALPQSPTQAKERLEWATRRVNSEVNNLKPLCLS